MTVKIYKSNLSWRSETYQDNLLMPVIPNWSKYSFYVDELAESHRKKGGEKYMAQRAALLRPTSRPSLGDIYVASLAVLSKDEDDFTAFMESLKDGKARLISVEDQFEWSFKAPIKEAVHAWRAAKLKAQEGAAKIGGRISADNRKKKTLKAIERIKEFWPLSSDTYPTKDLLEDAGISLNTAKKHLGSRIVAQHNHRAAEKRKEKRHAA